MIKNMISFFAISVLISLFAASCSLVDEPQGSLTDTEISDNSSNPNVCAYTLPASIECTVPTKTTLGEADAEGVRQVAWNLNDEVAVLYDGGSTKAYADAAGTSANLSFDAPTGDLWFAYPYEGDATLSEGRLSFTVPAEQDGTFANNSYLIAKANTSDETVRFFNACSMFKIVVSDATLKKAVITGNKGEKLAGAVSYIWSGANDEAPTADLTSAQETSLTVSFNGVGEYLVAALPGLELSEGVTIKFYRDNDEPAGGNATSSPLKVDRAMIASFGNSDAICNRYVSTSGKSSNNGRTPANAWDMSQFKAFLEGTAITGNKLAAMDGVAIHVADGTYTLTARFIPDIAIKTKVIGESVENTIIKMNSTNQIIFDIYMSVISAIEFKNLTFSNAINTNSEGGAFRISKGLVSFDNCKFSNNKTTSKQGAVMYITNTASVSIDNSQFVSNESSSSGSCLYVDECSGVVKINRSIFKNNKANNRGVFHLGANVLVYMNSVSFTGNTTTSNNSPWGILVHGGDSYVCMNNVSAYDNKNTSNVAKDCATLNCDAGMLIANSTFVDYGGQYIVRVHDATSKGNLTMFNSIFVNRSALDSPFWVSNTISVYNCGHNLRSSSSANGNVSDSTPATDMFNQTHETLSGQWSETWNSTDKYGVYAWTNNLNGFAPATASDVESAIKACTKSMAGVNNVGEDFYNWLVDIGGLQTDGRGQSRGAGNWWPGAYQN